MNLSKSKKQIIILYSTTILGVGLGVLVSILNTRSLTPNEYGDVRYINNFISFFSGILLFGYFTSGSRLLALAKTKEEVLQLKGCLIGILTLTIIAKVYKKTDFLRPVDKKVKTATIFVVKTRS